MMKKGLSIMLLSLISIITLAGCGTGNNAVNGSSGDNKEMKVLEMGTSADYPPFEYIDTTKGDEIIGFDIELANTVAEELGYKVKVEDIDFGGLIPALQSGKVDFVMAGMSPTPEREKSVDFSVPYYAADQVLVVKKDSNIKSLEDLNGKTIGVVVGSIQEGKAKELQKIIDMKVENRNRVPELIQEVKSNRFDAVIIENPVAKGFLEQNKDLESVKIPNPDTQGAGMVFPNDSKLTAEFNKVLNEMKENGELEKLIVKWFSGEQ